MYNVKLILDSINPAGKRLTTFLLTYPLNVHAELMTHRLFSRNAASARAVPVQKFIDAVCIDPVLPVVWRENQKGMEAAGELGTHHREVCEHQILRLRNDAVNCAEQLQRCNLHKSWINRYLQPWMWMTTLVTSCDFGNWFSLRADLPAQPEIMVVAYWMLKEYMRSNPQELEWEEWHIPGLTADELRLTTPEQLCVGTARAARASYTKFDTELTLEDAVRIHDGMIASGHWSPFEHSAQAIDAEMGPLGLWQYKDYPWSNFDIEGEASCWGQYRKSFPAEFRKPTEESLQERLDRMPDWVYNVILQCSK